MSDTYFYVGLFIASVIAFTESNSNEGKIVGGQKISINQVASLVSVQNRLGGSFIHLCGGTLVSPKYVISAAHCIVSARPDQLQIRAGSSVTNDGGQVQKVEDIIVHPKFTRTTFDYDIGILMLEGTIATSLFAPRIATFSKLEEESLTSRAMFYAAGWGITNPDSSNLSLDLYGIRMPYINRADCKSMMEILQITPRMICAGYKEGGMDTCMGDAGGPLYFNGEAYAIVSYGEGCAVPNKPTVHVKLMDPEIKAFIDEKIKS